MSARRSAPTVVEHREIASARRRMGCALITIALVSAPCMSSAQARPTGTSSREHWQLSPKPPLSIGGADGSGPTEFAGIVGVVRMRDGRIVVADDGSTELRMFAPNGRYLETIARKGSGPGEMQGVSALFYSSDSLYARDSYGGAHVFTSSGAYARSIRFLVGSRRGFGSSPKGVMARGALVGAFGVWDPRGRTVGTQRAEIRRLAGDGVVVSVLAKSAAWVAYQTPAGRSGALGFSPSLELVAFPREACYAQTASFIITCVDSLGTTTRTIRDSARPRAVTDSMQRAWRFASSGRLPDGGSRYTGSLREHRERSARETVFADKLPVIGRLLAAQTGDLWVSEYQPSDGIPSRTGEAPGAPAGATTWRIYAPNNVVRATLITPARFRVFDAGDGWVLGVARDADDIERVELWTVKAR